MIKDIHSFKISLPFKEELIKEILEKRTIDPNGFNFNLNTRFRKELYLLFEEKCKSLFKEFELIQQELLVWCSVSDKNFSSTNWHNHEKTANLNGVIYLKVRNNEKGIDFLDNGKVINYIPVENELLIFPSTLWHHPNVSDSDEQRISLNLELLTKQSTKEVFNKTNINEF